MAKVKVFLILSTEKFIPSIVLENLAFRQSFCGAKALAQLMQLRKLIYTFLAAKRKGGEAMRIIAGSRKGTRLKAVPGAKTRPTSDRVKEALFQMIGPYFQGGTGVDLYAGSGALGMEALSRGIEEMYFADKSGAAIKVIRGNAKKCHFEKRAHIYKQAAMQMAKQLMREKRKCSLILLDPPYNEQQLEKDISHIQEFGICIPETVIVAEHSSSLKLVHELGHFSKSRTKIFGDTQISIFTYKNQERNEQE
ncbi:16S rRNA (guanine(966)-N(2))-methyltransferase RsmD [Salicibibacter cibarius]|uniref:16S rRNA (Guanine(966)-N(2))-methyltransferase RsmD n=2 Tax=Salicibibacter cibarius TaxID=2743000 RepID=A0A7T6Z4P4_9BACI|nr:16S rRNA (guanine(966)-N(2))-methyltransferase RsmD [Salicibibacter cibarius]